MKCDWSDDSLEAIAFLPLWISALYFLPIVQTPVAIS
jgi:hypothetical protein